MTKHDNVIPFPGGHERDGIDARGLAEHLMDQLGGPHAAFAAIQQWMADSAGAFLPPTRPIPELLQRRAERAGYVVRVDLDGTRPPVWRRLRLASDLPLSRVHDVLQVTMGWTDSHLHHFQMGPDAKDFRMMPFLTDFDLEEGEDEGIHERDVRLDEVLATPGQRLFYEYDFGDSWSHTIRLEKVEAWREGDPDAFCITGRRACPPEDVGGVPGYSEVLAALAGDLGDDPEWTAQQLAWLPEDFDPAAFDAGEVNDLLLAAPLPDPARWHPAVTDLLLRAGSSPVSPLRALIASATTEPVTLTDDEVTGAVRRYAGVLAAVGDGVALTAAGYLPPRIVETVYRDLDIDRHWIGKGNREDLTYPVLSLRESATALGLLRKAKGRLAPTRAASSVASHPRALFHHIRDRLPLGRPHERDAGLVALLAAAAGQRSESREALDAFAQLGWRTRSGDLSAGLWHWSGPTREVLGHLTGDDDRGDHTTRIARALLGR